jgi:hypothetical protein
MPMDAVCLFIGLAFFALTLYAIQALGRPLGKP